MTRRVILWTLAVVFTLVSLVFQRLTGPTRAVRGAVEIGGTEIRLKLLRSWGGDGDQPVAVAVPDPEVTGVLAWRRYPTGEPWTFVPMARRGGGLFSSLPHQPPAGKLEYEVRLSKGTEAKTFPSRPAVTRFKGEVSTAVLVPHVAAMFLGMFFSTAAGLFALASDRLFRRLCFTALAVFCAGGLCLGPMVQKQAFGEYWTGIPWGWDLTDNKTLFAILAWALAAIALRGGRLARWPVVAATVVTLAVFAIPHSTWGSEIRWEDHPSSSPASTSAPSATPPAH